jgi:hypothetical protein
MTTAEQKESYEGIYGYPVQMADIRKGKWRFKDYIVKGYSVEQLKEEEMKLWKLVSHRADTAVPPPLSNPLLATSQLLGYGWEWATYAIGNERDVIKIPAGIFSEVETEEYLENTKFAYGKCEYYLAPYIRKTQFERRNIKGIDHNLITQERFVEPFEIIDLLGITSDIRGQLSEFARRALYMLGQEDWLPDLDLKKQEDGRWIIRNVTVDKGELQLFDFTAYYDAYRLSPDRSKEETLQHKTSWEELLNQLQKV